MHTNFNFEKPVRNQKRNATPPGDVEQEARKQEAKRGKNWSRENDKRQQWQENVEF